MPRSNRPRRAGRPSRPGRPGAATDDETGDDGAASGLASLARHRGETHAGVDYAVRSVSGAAATKTYRCPGCDQEILPGTPHVVAWPNEGPVHLSAGADNAPGRRHWHTPCWTARGRRGPRR